MNDDHLVSVAQLKEFAKLSNSAKFKSNSSKVETYEWVSNALVKFRYVSLKKKEKSVVKKYIMKMTGYSDGAVDKLIARKKKFGKIFVKERTQNTFQKFYQGEDIELLAEVSNVTLNQNGYALKEMCKSMYLDFSDLRFEKLSKISISHLYNLKKTNIYEHKSLFYTKTNPVQRNIGIRAKPQPFGKPGYIRIDSVHQGDRDIEKGVYYINMVDEVTQWEIIGCVERISEQFLEPLLRELLDRFPFVILNFHSDNGSEYINYVVARILKKLLIDQTKSRSRRTNDNALVESKNGAVIRKHMGRNYIQKKEAQNINKFLCDYMDDYLNFHRPCGFATDYSDSKGKIKKKYETYLTPYEKLISIPNFEQYLKPEVSASSLEKISKKQSDNESAQKMQIAKSKLFKNFTL